MKQTAPIKEARAMVKERLLDRRVEKLSRENEELRHAVEDLRNDLDTEHDRSKEALEALSKARRKPGRMKWLVLAGGAYVLGAKAGRQRYEQMRTWVRSMTQRNGQAEDGTAGMGTTMSTGTSASTPTSTPTTGT